MISETASYCLSVEPFNFPGKYASIGLWVTAKERVGRTNGECSKRKHVFPLVVHQVHSNLCGIEWTPLKAACLEASCY